MRSLRASLILGTTVGTAVVLIVAGVLLYKLVEAGLVAQFDRSLIDKARLLASMVEQKGRKVDLEFEELDKTEFQSPARGGYVQLWRADGGVLFRSPSLGREDLERAAGPLDRPLARKARLPNGRAARAVGITFQPRLEHEDRDARDVEHRGRDERSATRAAVAPETLTLVLARDAGSIDAVLVPLKVLLVSVGLVTMAVLWGVLWMIVRRGLRPLDRAAEQIGRLGEQDLSERIEVGDVPRELRPVVDRFNGLIQRLEAAFRRERAFAGDVAHELRTPLAGLRTTLEVAVSRARLPAEYQEAIADCLAIVGQMQAMVENLLSLARLESGQVEVRPGAVRLSRLIRETWQPLARAAGARHLHVQWSLRLEEPVTTDPALLGAVIRNVLENAVIHADEGGTVEVATLGGDGRTEIRVSNSAGAMSPEQAGHVFERYWRADAARSSTGVHCGLGLALVKKVTEVLGGAVEARCDADGRFHMAISIPTQGVAEPAQPQAAPDRAG
jgi:signal transduction histidine kinase